MLTGRSVFCVAPVQLLVSHFDMTLKPNKHGVYDKKHAEHFFVKNSNSEIYIYLLKIKSGWLSAPGVKTNNDGFSSPLTPNHNLYNSRDEAFSNAVQQIVKTKYVSQAMVNKIINQFKEPAQLPLLGG